MLPLIAAGLIIGGATAGAGLFGASKNKKDIANDENNRPVYTRPGEINQYLEQAKTNANSNLPGHSQYTQNAEQATQGSLTQLEDSNNLNAGNIQKLYQTELGAYNNLAMKQAQYHQNQQQQLSLALKEAAKYSDQEFEYNINSPWQRKYQNDINALQSNRSLIKTGIGIAANAVGKGGYGAQGSGQTQASDTSVDNGGYNIQGLPQYGENQYMNG